MKKTVIINQDSGYLIIDIANSLVNKDIDTSILAGRVVVRNKQLAGKVRVKKIMRYRRDKKYLRILSWLVAFFQVLVLVKTKYRKDHLFIFTNPPFALFLPLFCKNRFSLMIYDIYPDVLIQMGIIGDNSFLARTWKRNNKKVFSRADNIFTLTESMSLLLQKYSGAREVNIVPLWSDNSFFNTIPREKNPFLSEHKLEDRFVVLYSGNLGRTHNVEIFTELARRIRNPKVIFVIIGEGDGRKNVEENIRNLNLSNCLLLPLQPVDRIKYSFSAADIAMVSLSADASMLSLPSKTFSFMSAGLPLLCLAGEDSELMKLVSKYDNGKCYAPEKLEAIADFIEEMALEGDLLKTYKSNSLKASQNYTARNAGIISDILIKSIEKKIRK